MVTLILYSDNAIVNFIGDSNSREQKRGQFLGSTLKSTNYTFLVIIYDHMSVAI